ncbi:hypothetical protein M5K25_007265 [Dendrobium thyrsiflorum]|uniref:VQ domain-containing protein n=1 Tax=Dendrobium thyrsiflorum TaxID=117978 RepID=A0ABD0VDT8_DENTH
MVKLMNIDQRLQNKLPIHSNLYPKKKQNKQQPLKVIYFSNPMRISTTATAFRAVVQELTGRDSDIADILAGQTPFNSSSSLTTELGGADPFKLLAERFGSMEEYFAGLLPPSLQAIIWKDHLPINILCTSSCTTHPQDQPLAMVKLMNIDQRLQNKLPIHSNLYPKKKQNKQQPLKVIYFSNPMRISTTATAFRAVVQELTGRDSDIADILAGQTPFNSSSSLTTELGGADPFKLLAERFGSMEEYFAGLLPPSLQAIIWILYQNFYCSVYGSMMK